ncbi:MAG: phosphoglucosamine mutase [Eggerthellaceae bacterium]|nr:phosphoglucosamine mutase [Eggerthellaceae bacterium]
MMERLFGTDGVRGIANTKLSCDMAFKLGQAAVKFLGSTIVIGKDTRLSGDMLEAALASGVMSMGGTVLLVGIVPTPAIAFLTRELQCGGGVVISASHNPPAYNGIKFFDSRGFKLPDAFEDEIEAFIKAGGTPLEELPAGDMVGVSLVIENAAGLYVDHVVKSVFDQDISFSGLHVALDVAHGAASSASEEALVLLGAKVTVINNDYNGLDINVDCGSTNLAPLHKLMAKCGADVGIAHDGDADRLMIIGADGKEIDGEMIEAFCAIDLKERGALAGNMVAATVAGNLGFVLAMKQAGIEVLQTQVGDRYVLEAMLQHGCVLGGEQSGHVIMLDYNSTGDGLLVACQFLAACIRSGKTASQAASVMVKVPQVLINVQDVDKLAMESNEALALAVREAQAELGESGRVLIRPSGTEPCIRVMVEAFDPDMASRVGNCLAQVVKTELSL